MHLKRRRAGHSNLFYATVDRLKTARRHTISRFGALTPTPSFSSLQRPGKTRRKPNVTGGETVADAPSVQKEPENQKFMIIQGGIDESIAKEIKAFVTGLGVDVEILDHPPETVPNERKSPAKKPAQRKPRGHWKNKSDKELKRLALDLINEHSIKCKTGLFNANSGLYSELIRRKLTNELGLPKRVSLKKIFTKAETHEKKEYLAPNLRSWSQFDDNEILSKCQRLLLRTSIESYEDLRGRFPELFLFLVDRDIISKLELKCNTGITKTDGRASPWVNHTDAELLGIARSLIEKQGIKVKSHFTRNNDGLHRELVKRGIWEEVGIKARKRKKTKQPEKEKLLTKEEVRQLFAPFVRPAEYSDEQRGEAEKTIRRRYGPVNHGSSFSRGRVYKALMELGMEPLDARNTRLSELIFDSLPTHSTKEAWQFVVDNPKLVHAGAKRIAKQIRYPYGDILSESAQMLFYSMLYWDESKGAITTFFYANLPHAKRNIKHQRPLVRLPFHRTDEMLLLWNLKRKQGKLTVSLIAKELDVSIEKAEELYTCYAIYSHYPTNIGILEKFTGPSRMRENMDGTVVEKKPKHEIRPDVLEDLVTNPETEIMLNDTRVAVRKAISSLQNPIEKRVIRERFGIWEEDGEGKTLEEVSQIEKKSLEKLRRILKKMGIDEAF